MGPCRLLSGLKSKYKEECFATEREREVGLRLLLLLTLNKTSSGGSVELMVVVKIRTGIKTREELEHADITVIPG
jgi:hypothetical protein